MKNWKNKKELAVEEQKLAEMKIQRGICQFDPLTPKLFVRVMKPFKCILKKYIGI